MRVIRSGARRRMLSAMDLVSTRRVGLGVAGALAGPALDVAGASLRVAAAGWRTPLAAPVRRPVRALVDAAERRGVRDESRLRLRGRATPRRSGSRARSAPRWWTRRCRALIEARVLERVTAAALEGEALEGVLAIADERRAGIRVADAILADDSVERLAGPRHRPAGRRPADRAGARERGVRAARRRDPRTAGAGARARAGAGEPLRAERDRPVAAPARSCAGWSATSPAAKRCARRSPARRTASSTMSATSCATGPPPWTTGWRAWPGGCCAGTRARRAARELRRGPRVRMTTARLAGFATRVLGLAIDIVILDVATLALGRGDRVGRERPRAWNSTRAPRSSPASRRRAGSC